MLAPALAYMGAFRSSSCSEEAVHSLTHTHRDTQPHTDTHHFLSHTETLHIFFSYNTYWKYVASISLLLMFEPAFVFVNKQLLSCTTCIHVAVKAELR